MRGRYLKGATGAKYPGRIVSVVVATRTPPDVPARRVGTPQVFRSAHVCYTFRKSNKYAPARAVTFGSPGEFWRWLESFGRVGSRTYVFSPIASDALVLLRGFDRFDAMGARWVKGVDAGPRNPTAYGATSRYTFGRCVLAGKPDIVEYTDRTGRYLWLSGHNYFRETEGHVAQATGYEWRTRGDADDGPVFVPADPGDRAAMWLHAMMALADWWGPLRAGAFPVTAPAGAWSFLKSRLPPKLLCDHDCPDTLRLERLCCHGGRATTWFYGDVRPRGAHSPPPELGPPPSGWPVIRGPIYQYDVRSTYPTLMRDMDFPVKRSHYTTRIEPGELRDLCVNFHVIASVILRTETPEYPHRRRDRVMYPVGRFRSFLTTPELIVALDAGEVESVACAAAYFKGRPFERAAAELIDMRERARADGRPGWEMFVKLVSNSMTGKLAPRKYTWTAAPGVALARRWGYEYLKDMATGRVVKYMARMGMVWERSADSTTRGTTAACYGVLQAYCRLNMRRLRELLPPRSVVSQGTDGVWVTGPAARVLDRDVVQVPVRPGSVRRVVSVSNARFLDSRHYWCDGVWTVAGVPSGGMLPCGTAYAYPGRLNPVISAPEKPPVHVYEEVRTAQLNCRPIDMIVGDDGWGQPVRLPQMPGQQPAAPADPQEGIPW